LARVVDAGAKAGQGPFDTKLTSGLSSSKSVHGTPVMAAGVMDRVDLLIPMIKAFLDKPTAEA
jgi:hypothetical protein